MAKSRQQMTHRHSDEWCIKQDRQLIITMDPDATVELERMNKGNIGRPFTCPESTIMMIAMVQAVCGPAYRVYEGMAGVLIGRKNTPDFTTIWRRIKKWTGQGTTRRYGQERQERVVGSHDDTGLASFARS